MIKFSYTINRMKITAILVLNCFLFSFVYGNAAAAVYESVQSSWQRAQMSVNLALPYSYGKVTETYTTGSQRLIIQIQDLHCHPQVQKNISNIIELVDKQTGNNLKAVYLEGAFGDVDTSWLKPALESVPGSGNAERSALLDKVLQTGRLTGAEYYSVLTEKYGIIKGLENKEEYLDNLKRFGHILEQQKEILQILKGVEESSDDLKKRYYNKKQTETESLFESYSNNEISGRKYYALLSKYTDRLGIDINKYENISLYMSLPQKEKELKYKEISKELQSYMVILKDKIPYSAYKMLSDSTDNFKQTDKLCGHLIILSKEFKIDLSGKFSELGKFFEYVETSQKINPLELINEERQLRNEINAGLSETTAQSEAVFLVNFNKRLKDYLTSKITSKDYAYYKENISNYKKLWVKHIDNRVLSLLEDYIKEADNFYEVNVNRNSSFAKQLRLNDEITHEKMNAATDTENTFSIGGFIDDSDNKEVEIVVTGGFHTEGISDILKENGISYLVITPNVDTGVKEAEEVYYKIAKLQSARLGANDTQAYDGRLSLQPDSFVAEASIDSSAIANMIATLSPSEQAGLLKDLGVSPDRIKEMYGDIKLGEYVLSDEAKSTQKIIQIVRGAKLLESDETEDILTTVALIIEQNLPAGSSYRGKITPELIEKLDLEKIKEKLERNGKNLESMLKIAEARGASSNELNAQMKLLKEDILPQMINFAKNAPEKIAEAVNGKQETYKNEIDRFYKKGIKDNSELLAVINLKKHLQENEADVKEYQKYTERIDAAIVKYWQSPKLTEEDKEKYFPGERQYYDGVWLILKFALNKESVYDQLLEFLGNKDNDIKLRLFILLASKSGLNGTLDYSAEIEKLSEEFENEYKAGRITIENNFDLRAVLMGLHLGFCKSKNIGFEQYNSIFDLLNNAVISKETDRENFSFNDITPAALSGALLAEYRSNYLLLDEAGINKEFLKNRILARKKIAEDRPALDKVTKYQDDINGLNRAIAASFDLFEQLPQESQALLSPKEIAHFKVLNNAYKGNYSELLKAVNDSSNSIGLRLFAILQLRKAGNMQDFGSVIEEYTAAYKSGKIKIEDTFDLQSYITCVHIATSEILKNEKISSDLQIYNAISHAVMAQRWKGKATGQYDSNVAAYSDLVFVDSKESLSLETIAHELGHRYLFISGFRSYTSASEKAFHEFFADITSYTADSAFGIPVKPDSLFENLKVFNKAKKKELEAHGISKGIRYVFYKSLRVINKQFGTQSNSLDWQMVSDAALKFVTDETFDHKDSQSEMAEKFIGMFAQDAAAGLNVGKERIINVFEKQDKRFSFRKTALAPMVIVPIFFLLFSPALISLTAPMILLVRGGVMLAILVTPFIPLLSVYFLIEDKIEQFFDGITTAVKEKIKVSENTIDSDVKQYDDTALPDLRSLAEKAAAAATGGINEIQRITVKIVSSMVEVEAMREDNLKLSENLVIVENASKVKSLAQQGFNIGMIEIAKDGSRGGWTLVDVNGKKTAKVKIISDDGIIRFKVYPKNNADAGSAMYLEYVKAALEKMLREGARDKVLTKRAIRQIVMPDKGETLEEILGKMRNIERDRKGKKTKEAVLYLNERKKEVSNFEKFCRKNFEINNIGVYVINSGQAKEKSIEKLREEGIRFVLAETAGQVSDYMTFELDGAMIDAQNVKSFSEAADILKKLYAAKNNAKNGMNLRITVKFSPEILNELMDDTSFSRKEYEGILIAAERGLLADGRVRNLGKLEVNVDNGIEDKILENNNVTAIGANNEDVFWNKNAKEQRETSKSVKEQFEQGERAAWKNKFNDTADITAIEEIITELAPQDESLKEKVKEFAGKYNNGLSLEAQSYLNHLVEKGKYAEALGFIRGTALNTVSKELESALKEKGIDVTELKRNEKFYRGVLIKTLQIKMAGENLTEALNEDYGKTITENAQKYLDRINVEVNADIEETISDNEYKIIKLKDKNEVEKATEGLKNMNALMQDKYKLRTVPKEIKISTTAVRSILAAA